MGGSEATAPQIISFGIRWRFISVTPDEGAPVHIGLYGGLSGAQSRSELYLCWESNPDFPVAQTVVTILTELPQLSSTAHRKNGLRMNKYLTMTHVRFELSLPRP
jgi:hypothetical protein